MTQEKKKISDKYVKISVFLYIKILKEDILFKYYRYLYLKRKNP